jgi:hypothetical protein
MSSRENLEFQWEFDKATHTCFCKAGDNDVWSAWSSAAFYDGVSKKMMY